MKKIEIISLFGLEVEYEERTPPDLDLLNPKKINMKFEKLKCADEFKHVYENSKEYLENILANRKYKRGFQQAKNVLMDNVYAEQKMRIEQNKNDKKTTLKTRR